jgi:ABC-type multidrug transport system fused ATPase/permease subunit
MLKNLYLLILVVSKFFKKKIIFLQFLIIFNSILQILSVLSFGPLVLFLTKPERMYDYNYFFLKNLNNETMLLSLISIIVTLFILSNISNMIVAKISLTLGQKIGIHLNYKIFSNIIHRDYKYHVETNSADTISKITFESARVVNSILIPILLINARLVIVCVVFLGIFLINFKVSAIVLVFIIISYLIILFFQKKKLLKNSRDISNNNRLRQKAIAESIGNMRETIIFESQKFFLDIFNKSNKIIGMSIANNQFLAAIPRHVIEAISFTIVMIFIFMMYSKNILNDFLPTIAIYLVAAYKLLPAIQGIATSYASIKGNYTALINILPEINSISNENYLEEKTNFKKDINFFKININNFSFAYKDKQIFKNTNFEIKKNQIIGIFGETGVGKSTFIDIFCGLTEPTEGNYILNDKLISKEEKSEILKIISLVPQRINLLDDTIKNNIIYSQKKSNNYEDDLNKLEKLKAMCELNYIDNKFVTWDTLVGENGSKLSGGQIQRIGIARALYKNPQILILDEATSALDEITEKKLINNLLNSRLDLSIIIISHKKEIFKHCDLVYETRQGQLIMTDKK